MRGDEMRRLGILGIAVVLVAARDMPLASGLWEIRNTPGVAKLDGKTLANLPLAPIRTDTICLTAAAAAAPAAFFTRDLGEGCTNDDAVVHGGKVGIAGTCPNQDGEGERGRYTLAGSYAGDSYTVQFATDVVGENGRMTFSGTMTGKRVGACPA
jgi:hypothetical protein